MHGCINVLDIARGTEGSDEEAVAAGWGGGGGGEGEGRREGGNEG